MKTDPELVTTIIKMIVERADELGEDRDNLLYYVAWMLTTFGEVASLREAEK